MSLTSVNPVSIQEEWLMIIIFSLSRDEKYCDIEVMLKIGFCSQLLLNILALFFVLKNFSTALLVQRPAQLPSDLVGSSHNLKHVFHYAHFFLFKTQGA